MSYLKIERPRVIQTAVLRKRLTQSLNDMALAESRQRSEESRRNTIARRRTRAPLAKMLKGVKKESQSASALQFAAAKKAVQEKMKLAARRRPIRKKGPSNAVFGQIFGSDVPPYDGQWSPGLFVNPPNAIEGGAAADPASGVMFASVDTSSGARTIDGYAGMMFFYFPNNAGVLLVSAAPALDYYLAAGCTNDYGNADVYISLGIEAFDANSGRSLGWTSGVRTDHIASLDIGWYDDEVISRAEQAHSMAVFTPASPDQFYACWLWIRASAARDDEGYGIAFIEAIVPAFNFFFF